MVEVSDLQALSALKRNVWDALVYLNIATDEESWDAVLDAKAALIRAWEVLE